MEGIFDAESTCLSVGVAPGSGRGSAVKFGAGASKTSVRPLPVWGLSGVRGKD